MKRDQRHYSEEELLFHLLGEDTAEASAATKVHLERCSECTAVLRDFAEFRTQLLGWKVEEPGDTWWQETGTRLLEAYRDSRRSIPKRASFDSVARTLRSAWSYALENPLPTMGYVAAVLAFASERTITVFRLDRLLPRTSEMLEILRQVL